MPNEERLSRLLAEYRAAADSAGDLSNARKQRKAADKVHACYKELRETEEGRQGIISMMSEPSLYVREWAGAHSLQWEPESARRVLEKLRDEGSFPCSASAEAILFEFDKGRLSFDY